MTKLSRLLPAAASVLCAGALIAPGVAAAKGGTPSPTPAPAPVLCDYTTDGFTADGGNVFSNQAGDAGCISIVQRNQTLRLYAVALTPGWTYEVVKNGEGTASTVLLKFSNAQTGGRVEARIEFGKTWIR